MYKIEMPCLYTNMSFYTEIIPVWCGEVEMVNTDKTKRSVATS